MILRYFGIKIGSLHILWRDVLQQNEPPCLIIEHPVFRFALFFFAPRSFYGHPASTPYFTFRLRKKLVFRLESR